MNRYEFILTGIAGAPDTKRFKTEEEMRQFREEMEETTKEDFRRFAEARRKAIEDGNKRILD